ncbi:MAG: acetyl-CoA decarbonylase/synthase complex subunit gamma [Anaerolineales bacterium]|nr:acetyl-CoA decarbonylase/synthase complex subunit gamma [Anaerolineales bacterium]
MALSGIQIYKLLPQTNCKDCGFPTCLAFAMKLAAKQVELAACPHVTAAAKAQLAESSAPPIRLVTLKANGNSVKAGNETVLFRHEKTFFNKPGLFIRIKDDLSLDDIKAKVAPAEAFKVNYVGIDLTVDGFAVESVTGDPGAFSRAVSTVRETTHRPLILISRDPAVMSAGLQAVDGENPLLYAADATNWEAMAALAKQHQAALAVTADSLEASADLTEKIKAKGVEDLVLDPGGRDFATRLIRSTQIRRLALKKNFRPLGYPLIAFPGDAGENESMLAVQAIAKYAGFVVLDSADPELLYPLLVIRQNIYTDPQKPIQVQPGLYEINNPKPTDPVLVTTNFSITYFSVANEVESSGLPAWLLVADAEGMSVLTAWAAGKFDAERIAKDVKAFGVADKISNKRLVLPGHVAVLSGELEEELPGWEIRVGPREAVDLPRFMKEVLANV